MGGDWRGGGVEYNNMYITLEPPSLSISMLVGVNYLGSLWLQCCLRLVCFSDVGFGCVHGVDCK